MSQKVGRLAHQLGKLVELEIFHVDLGGDDAGGLALVGEEGGAERVDVVLLGVDPREALELVVGHVAE